MKRPAGVTLTGPAKRRVWTETSLSHLNQVKLSSLDGIAEGFLCLIMAHKAQLHCRNYTVKKTLTKVQKVNRSWDTESDP